MTMPYYRLMGQIFVAVQTWDSLPDVREATSKVGLTKDQVDDGKRLVDHGEELAARRIVEGGTDRIAIHNVHQAVSELEMWLQTVKFGLRDRIGDEEVIKRSVEHGLHSGDHTVTATASALRTLGVLRTDANVEAGFARPQSLHDLVVRGQTLLAKVLECTQVMMAESLTSRESDVYGQIADHHPKMKAWITEFARVAEKVKEQPEILGLLGYLPDGVGRPGGGTSFAVPLHKNAQREAPDPSQEGSTSGWSIGRQGRNKENLGKGFVEPTFE